MINVVKGIFFDKKMDAAKYFNVNEKTIYNWIKKGGDSDAIL